MQIDPAFDAARFLDGAEKAFRIIVGAFASGDRTTLRSLLADDTYRAFAQAIEAREAAGHVQVSEVRRMETVAVEAAELRGSVAVVTVRFVSDQVSFTRDKDGHPVVGTDACDRDNRSLDVRAGPRDARSDLASRRCP